MNEEQAGKLKIDEGQQIMVISGSDEITLPVITQSDWPIDHLGISVGYKNTLSIDLNLMARLEKTETNDG